MAELTEILVTRYTLEMAERPTPVAARQLSAQQARLASPTLNRYFYASVGYNWLWYGRFAWTYDQWAKLVTRDSYETWLAYREGTPVGYFELDCAVPERTEIAYFGLLQEFVGQGFGSELLSLAVANAWRAETRTVWLHTCSLDHPSALPNYLRGGFAIVDQVEEVEQVPTEPLLPWAQSGLRPVTVPEDHLKPS